MASIVSDDLTQICPLLLPTGSKQLAYAGYMSVGDQSFFLSITLPDSRLLQHARLNCDWKLREYLKGHEHIIRKRLAQSENLYSFFIEFKSLLSQLLTVNVTSSLPSPSYYLQMIKDIECIGWDKIVSTDERLMNFSILSRDKKGREHILSLHLSDKYPTDLPSVETDLPVPFKPSSLLNSVKDIVLQFEKVLDNYQLFWDTMDEIDHNTWVLDPESPSRSCVYRRIVISSSTSVHLTVNPMKCLDVPDCTLLGPTHAIDPLKNILYSQLHKWNNSVSLLTNLQMVLSLEFPLCSTTNKDDYVVECGICYAHRLHDNETTPDITCNNHHCVQVYHYFCLYEWFRSLPTTRENFNLLFGECPYCNEGITIPLKT